MPGEASAPFLEIQNVIKTFGDFTALKDVSLSIDEGAFVCFLGPSGCGKTTLLRAIAGLDRQTSGRIFQRGAEISDLPPAKRDFGIVFQSYALFPNLTVAANVGYGLVNRGMKRAAIAARVNELLALVGLPDAGPKYPAALSGGQQQRVALARALATDPALLLLDEPLSALDAKVRVHLRHEMKELQRRLGVTTIMVTHDQEEALTLADQIVVMNHGLIEQVGSPIEVYRTPASAYVADFVGEMNFLAGHAQADGTARFGDMVLDADGLAGRFADGATVTLAIRPEDVLVRGADEHPVNRLQTTVETVDFLGSYCRAELAVEGDGDTRITANLSINLMRDLGVSEGHKLAVALPPDRLRVFAGGADR